MANGYSVIPLDDEQLGNEGLIKFLADEMIFVSANLPHGRFPTMSELRNSIREFGYSLEETHDWYVTSEDDFTEIWFRGENRRDDSPIEFWFRRGDLIVLDIAQSLANKCGSIVIASHSGSPIVLLVPDMVFPASLPYQGPSGFVEVMSRRFPVMVKRLAEASLEETLFILSQIRQILQGMDYLRQNKLFQIAQQGMSEYLRLLNHEDAHVRYMAFDLVVTFPEKFYEYSEFIRLSIKNENVPRIKEQMIDAIDKLIVGRSSSSETDHWTKSLLDLLLELSNNAEEDSPVRFAATNRLARAQPGLLTPAMRTVFIDALVQPEHYGSINSLYYIIEQALKSIENLLLNHRIEILTTALPRISFAQDAHDVLRALMDYVFFGAIRSSWMSAPLPDTQVAERPKVDETKFRDGLSRNWLYPANPTKLTATELMLTQRTVLETVLALDIPWMVHSNLLEKYGLPPTRASTRALLEMNE